MAPRRKTHLGRPKGVASGETRARILSAARTCFSRSGYAATANKEIAEEAGVTTAAIYVYFESKEALYKATVRDAYEELLPHYAAAAGAVSLREGFRRVLAASAPLHKTDPSLAAFFSALPVEMKRHPELAPVVQSEGAAIAGLFAKVVELGVRKKEITRAQAPHVLSLFIACTMGLSLYITTIDDTHFQGIIDAFSALIEGTLFR
jgi:AcrR family transcriptional regulator